MALSSLQYNGELYLEHVHKFGYPSAEDRKEFNRRFYSLYRNLVNHRDAVVAVGSFHHSLKMGIVPGWAKRSPDVHKTFIEVKADYNTKYANKEKPKAAAPLLLVELRSQERLEKKRQTLSSQGKKAIGISLDDFLAQQQKLYEARVQAVKNNPAEEEQSPRSDVDNQMSMSNSLDERLDHLLEYCESKESTQNVEQSVKSLDNSDASGGMDVASTPSMTSSMLESVNRLIAQLEAEQNEGKTIVLKENNHPQNDVRISSCQVKQVTSEEIPTEIDRQISSTSLVLKKESIQKESSEEFALDGRQEGEMEVDEEMSTSGGDEPSTTATGVDEKSTPPSTDVLPMENDNTKLETTMDQMEDARPLKIEQVEEDVIVLKSLENKRKRRRRASTSRTKEEIPEEIPLEKAFAVVKEISTLPTVIEATTSQSTIDNCQLQKRIQQLEKEAAEKDAILLEWKKKHEDEQKKSAEKISELEEELKKSQRQQDMKDETIQQLSEKFQTLKEKMELKDIIIQDKERTIQILSSYGK